MRKTKLLATILAMTMAFSLSLPTAAATKAKNITITGKKTVYVGKKIELDTTISPKKAKIKDSKIIWSSSNPSVAKVLENKDDDTKIKGLKAGTAVITVKIKGTKISDTHKVTVKKAKTSTTGTSSDEKKLETYKKSAQNLAKEIKETKLASTAKERRTQYKNFEKKLDKIENQLDKIEDKWEEQWENGKISRKTYRAMEKKVEAVEEYLDTVEDLLEEKFEYEFED